MHDEKSPRTLAQDAFVEYLDHLRRGEDPDRAAFVTSRPAEVRAELERIFEDYEILRRLSRDITHGLEPGRILGDFRLVQEIGRGSMGIVWEADQISLGRKVALKLLHPHLSLSSTSQRRFQLEAEAGGRLNHPSIVTIHEIGEQEGVHYIAQELVPGGESLSDLLAAKRERPELDREYWRSIVDLFVTAADALEFAHRSGVVHRDIKPGNILLTPAGMPKISGFGLAKTQDDLGLSRTGECLGTPFYMSPEQAAGRREEIDARTDVYSLGATLYEALTLARPFEGGSSREIVEQILTCEPPDPRRIRPRLPRDLAVICLAALEKKPERRYASMQALCEDLRRHLANEPIRARPPGTFGRALRWGRRHPVITASGSIAAASVVLLSGLLVENRAARLRAEDERAVTSEVLALSHHLFELLDTRNSSTRSPFSREIAANLVDLAERRLGDLPELKVQALSDAGRGYRMIGDLQFAAATLERAHGISTQKLPDDSAAHLAVLQELSRAYGDLDQFRESQKLDEEGLRLATSRLGPGDPTTLAFSTDLYLSYVREQNGPKSAEFEKKYGSLEEMLKQNWARQRNDSGEDGFPAIESQSGLARLCFYQGRFSEAENLYRSVLPAQSRRLGELNRRTLETRLMWATAVQRSQDARMAEAEGVQRAVLEDMQRELGEDDYLIAKAKWFLARSVLDQLRMEEALPIYEDAIRALTQSLGPHHMDTLNARAGLGILYGRMHRFQDAERVLSNVFRDFQRTLGEDHTETLIAARALCEVYSKQGRFGEEEALLRDCLARHSRLRGEFHPDTFTTIHQLSTCLLNQGRGPESEALVGYSLSIAWEHFGEGARETIDEIRSWIYVLTRSGRLEDAASEVQALLDRPEREVRNLEKMNLREQLGRIRWKQGRLEEAEHLLRLALEEGERVWGENSPLLADYLPDLAQVLHLEDRDREAEPLARKAVKLTSCDANEHDERARILESIEAERGAAGSGSTTIESSMPR